MQHLVLQLVFLPSSAFVFFVFFGFCSFSPSSFLRDHPTDIPIPFLLIINCPCYVSFYRAFISNRELVVQFCHFRQNFSACQTDRIYTPPRLVKEVLIYQFNKNHTLLVLLSLLFAAMTYEEIDYGCRYNNEK